jgi:GTP cyclohydrolase I
LNSSKDFSNKSLVDVQNQTDTREIPLQKVGVKGLRYPVQVLDKADKVQNTTAEVSLFVNLPDQFKGTHMSRFIEIFHKHHKNLSMKHFLAMLEEIRENLDAARAFGEMSFPLFLEKAAPVSGQKGMMVYDCTYEGSVSAGDMSNTGETRVAREFFVSVAVPVTTVCPCSRAISNRGAHNQRGIVTVKIQCKAHHQSASFFWIEDIIEIVEKSASSALYSLLKREDEKYVTEYAYDNPRFVEDLVREVYLGIIEFGVSRKEDFPWFSIEAENFESIHNHSAFACAEYRSQKG